MSRGPAQRGWERPRMPAATDTLPYAIHVLVEEVAV